MSFFRSDLKISNYCNLTDENNFSELGTNYQLPDGFIYKSETARSFLAGSYNFTVDEIEVFLID
jgi:hypothetical protein